MSLVVYDVTAEVVLKYLPQWGTSGATRPGSAEIDTAGHWLNVAAADLEEAMLAGGYSSSVVNSTDYPAAYYQLKHILAERAALYYTAALGHAIDDEGKASPFARNDAKLQSISMGDRVGELTTTDTVGQAVFVHGTDTRDEINDSRFAWDDNL